MKYILMAYESQGELDARGLDGSQRQGVYWAGWKAFGEALAKAGVVESMHGLQPENTAATVKLMDGNPSVQEGAYASSQAQLGGYFIIEAPDMQAAIDWASRCPAALTGAVEVRPLLLAG
jgi:hypothetical protein